MRNLIPIALSFALSALLLAAPGCVSTPVYGGGGYVALPPQPVEVATPTRVKTDDTNTRRPNDLGDPCAMRMEDIIGQLYVYYSMYKQLPDKLEDLRTVSGVNLELKFTCPVTGKPYVYNPVGLQAQAGDPLHLILYDATPAHNGRRWGVVAGPAPNRTGQIFLMYVVQLTDDVFHSFTPVPAPLTQPAPVTADPPLPDQNAGTPPGQP